jgi:hypothetical protein
MANPGGRLSATDPIEAFVVEPFPFHQFENGTKSLDPFSIHFIQKLVGAISPSGHNLSGTSIPASSVMTIATHLFFLSASARSESALHK